jgi:hypothetical protein
VRSGVFVQFAPRCNHAIMGIRSGTVSLIELNISDVLLEAPNVSCRVRKGVLQIAP